MSQIYPSLVYELEPRQYCFPSSLVVLHPAPTPHNSHLALGRPGSLFLCTSSATVHMSFSRASHSLALLERHISGFIYYVPFFWSADIVVFMCVPLLLQPIGLHCWMITVIWSCVNVGTYVTCCRGSDSTHTPSIQLIQHLLLSVFPLLFLPIWVSQKMPWRTKGQNNFGMPYDTPSILCRGSCKSPNVLFLENPGVEWHHRQDLLYMHVCNVFIKYLLRMWCCADDIWNERPCSRLSVVSRLSTFVGAELLDMECGICSVSIPQAGQVPVHLHLLPGHGFHAPQPPISEVSRLEQEWYWAQWHGALAWGLSEAEIESKGRHGEETEL